jgi:MFS family permease
MTSLRTSTREAAPEPGTGDAPRRRDPFWTTWAVVVLLLVVSFGVTYLATRPTPEGDAGRGALATSQRLQDIGVRVPGTDELSRGLGFVEGQLRGIPGLEVERQHASGTYRFHDRDVAYGVDNVVARLQGDSDDTLLVNAHVDSAWGSTGAADDGVAVGAMIEAARRLAGEDHRRTVVFLFNGGEEVGLTGSDAFTRHPWARDVRWFLNLEAIGSSGQPLMFNAGADNGALVDLVGNTPRPYGSILGQTLFGAGLINSDTDSRVWRGAGWSGLDYAIIENGYGYDTPLDRTDRIDAGTAQSYVDLVTGYVRAAADDSGTAGSTPYYFDVLSRWWVTVDPWVAVLTTLVMALAVAALVWRSRRVRAGHVVASAGAGLLGILAAVVTGALAGTLAWLTGGSHAWFAHPWLVWVLPLPLTVFAAVLPQVLVRRRRARRDPSTLDSAGAVVWYANLSVVAFLGLLTAVLGVGAAYLLWTATALGVLATLVALPLRGRWRLVPLVVAALAQCVLVAELARSLMTLAVPMLGRVPAAIPMDPVLGVVVAVIGVLLAFVLAPFVFHGGHLRRVALAAVVVTVAGLVTGAVAGPYDTERPKYVEAFQVQGDDGEVRIEFEGRDFHTPQNLGLVDDIAGATGLPVDGGTLVGTEFAVPSGTVGFAGNGTDGPVEVRLGANEANLVRITVTGAVTALNGRPFDGGEAVVDVVGRPEGYAVTVDRTGPVRIEVDQVFVETGPDMAKVLAALPPWAFGHGRTVVRDTFAEPGA